MDWRTLEGSQDFKSLLHGDYPPLLPRIAAFQIGSVLDLGCGDGNTLLSLYHALGTTHLEGVDNEQASYHTNIINAFRGKDAHMIDLTQVWLGMRASKSDAMPTITDRAEMVELMRRVRYGTDIIGYKPELKEYDAIILSNVLHYMYPEQVTQTLAMVRERIRIGGLIYIGVRDAFKLQPHLVPPINGQALLAHLHAFASEMGLTHTLGAMTQIQGQYHHFTNL